MFKGGLWYFMVFMVVDWGKIMILEVLWCLMAFVVSWCLMVLVVL